MLMCLSPLSLIKSPLLPLMHDICDSGNDEHEDASARASLSRLSSIVNSRY